MMKASVVIPTYNKLSRLKLVLESLKYQNEKEENYEVILVDDGSNDGTKEYIEAEKFPFQLIYCAQNNCGRASARNLGVCNAKYDIIIFTDDDLILDANFIHNHIKHHKNKEQIVHGRIMSLTFTKFFLDPTKGTFLKGLQVRESIRKSLMSQRILPDMLKKENFDENIARKSKMTSLESVTKLLLEQQPGTMDWISFVGGNISVPKNVFKDAQGFDEKFGLKWGCEDIELGYRLFQKGYQFCYADEAVNYHISHYRQDFIHEHEINVRYFYTKYRDERINLFHKFISKKISKEEFLKQICRKGLILQK